MLIIDVPNGEDKPYACSRGFFMRVGANTQKLERDEIISFYKSEGKIRFETLVNKDANFKEHFDPKALKRFMQLARIKTDIDKNILLRNLKCLTPDGHFTNLGVLFFAEDIDFIMEHAIVVCVLYKGIEKVNIIDRENLSGNIIYNIDKALAFVKRNTNVEYVITGKPQREEIYDYPEEAIREAIVNAVCHRDYFHQGARVLVEVFPNRVEISNPGGLPRDLKEKDFGIRPSRRNPLIASLLHRVEYVEELGTGIKRIRDAVKAHKRKIKLDIQYDTFYSITFYKEGAKNIPNASQTHPKRISNAS